MKIYKFRNFRKEEEIEYFYQIIFHKTMWCANPYSLNDEEEFKFTLDYRESHKTLHVLAESMHKSGKIETPYQAARFAIDSMSLNKNAEPVVKDLISNIKSELGIASFTLTNESKRLWNSYGGRKNGVCIEFEIAEEDLNLNGFKRVNYVNKKIFHVDELFEAHLNGLTNADFMKKILTTKNKHWEYENEIRFINLNGQNLLMPIPYAQILSITFGSGIPQHTLDRIEKKIYNHCKKENIEMKRTED